MEMKPVNLKAYNLLGDINGNYYRQVGEDLFEPIKFVREEAYDWDGSTGTWIQYEGELHELIGDSLWFELVE